MSEIEQSKIGDFISSCRKEKKLTQAKFAEKLGVSDKAVSKWETGKCMPDMSLYQPICDILEITINEFMAGEKMKEESVISTADENLKSLIKLYVKVKSQKLIWEGLLLVAIGQLLRIGGVAEISSSVQLFMNGLSIGLSVGMSIIGIIMVLYGVVKSSKLAGNEY